MDAVNAVGIRGRNTCIDTMQKITSKDLRKCMVLCEFSKTDLAKLGVQSQTVV